VVEMEKRVLFVDDDQSLLVLYRRAFSRLGYQVLSATDAEQALQVFRQESPDAVVVDVRLGGQSDGLDLLGKILVLRRIPAIINTAFASFRETFLSWSADAYVLKSSDLTELAETLKRLLSPQPRKEKGEARPAEAVAAGPS
jgi:two-component system response regulator (stage 0 sporulation protein F)